MRLGAGCHSCDSRPVRFSLCVTQLYTSFLGTEISMGYRYTRNVQISQSFLKFYRTVQISRLFKTLRESQSHQRSDSIGSRCIYRITLPLHIHTINKQNQRTRTTYQRTGADGDPNQCMLGNPISPNRFATPNQSTPQPTSPYPVKRIYTTSTPAPTKTTTKTQPTSSSINTNARQIHPIPSNPANPEPVPD